MAHDANVLIKDEGSLYKVLENLERNMDSVARKAEQIEHDAAAVRAAAAENAALKAACDKALAELAEERARNEARGEQIGQLIARCDMLDKQQARGSTLYGDGKDYTPVGFHRGMTREQHEGVIVFGRYLEDRIRQTLGMPARYDLITRSQTEGTTTAGGNVVPVPIMDGVQWLRDRYGLARRDCAYVTMTSKTMPIPTSTTGPTVYFATAENTAPSESQAAIVNPRPTLSAEKIVAYDIVSVELGEDASPGFQSFLTERFLEAVGLKEDSLLFNANNDSSSGWYGLLTVTGAGATQLGGSTTSGSTSFHNIKYDDIVNTMAVADLKVHNTGKFYFSSYVLDQIRKIKDNDGQPLLAPLSAGAGLTLLGRPFETHSQLPALASSTATTPFLIYADLKASTFFGDRRGVEVSFSDQYKFAEAGLTMRVLERVAIVVALPSAIGRLSTATS